MKSFCLTKFHAQNGQKAGTNIWLANSDSVSGITRKDAKLEELI
jgi:hypothetical protein